MHVCLEEIKGRCSLQIFLQTNYADHCSAYYSAVSILKLHRQCHANEGKDVLFCHGASCFWVMNGVYGNSSKQTIDKDNEEPRLEGARSSRLRLVGFSCFAKTEGSRLF
jgi:hypothetical protein